MTSPASSTTARSIIRGYLVVCDVGYLGRRWVKKRGEQWAEVESPNATSQQVFPSSLEGSCSRLHLQRKTNFPFEMVCFDAAFEFLHQCEERPLSLTKVGYVPRPSGSDTRVGRYCILSDT